MKDDLWIANWNGFGRKLRPNLKHCHRMSEDTKESYTEDIRIANHEAVSYVCECVCTYTCRQTQRTRGILSDNCVSHVPLTHSAYTTLACNKKVLCHVKCAWKLKEKISNSACKCCE